MFVKHCSEKDVSFLDMDYDCFLVKKSPSYSEIRQSRNVFRAESLHMCEINKRNFYVSKKKTENPTQDFACY